MTLLRLGALSVDTEEPERRRVFDACHNGTQGHHGVLRTVEELRRLEREWPRMTRDVTRWIAEYPQYQKIRAREPEAAAILSPIGAFLIFEEISVDFVGPLPKDEVGNSYILNAVCSTTRYCELFAVEAATGVIAAHCLLAITARYGCFRRVRSDRGSHFVNEVIEEFLRLFEIQQVLTLAQRPQANALAERNGGEVMRHLRAIVLDKGLCDAPAYYAGHQSHLQAECGGYSPPAVALGAHGLGPWTVCPLRGSRCGASAEVGLRAGLGVWVRAPAGHVLPAYSSGAGKGASSIRGRGGESLRDWGLCPHVLPCETAQ